MNKKISLTVLLLTLTACGGGNSPVSTLPEIVPTNADFSKISSMKTRVDNKAEIVAYVESLGINLTTDISSSGDENRSASSRRRTASNSGTLATIESKYAVAVKKYADAKKLLDKGIENIRNASENAIAELLKFFGKWQDGRTGKDIVESMDQSELENIDKSSIANKMTLKTIELDQVKFRTVDVYSETHEESLNFEKDENGNYSKLKWITDDGHSHIGNVNEDGSYKFSKKQYTYDFRSTYGQLTATFEEGVVPSLQEVKDKLIENIYNNPNIHFYSDEERVATVKAEIDALTEGDLENGNDRLEVDVFEPLDLTYVLLGKNLNLSYSDYGYITIKDGLDGDRGFAYGGYDDKHISDEVIKNINEEMVFKGNAIGEVLYEEKDGNSEFLPLDGDATLNLNKGLSTLDVKFDNWYNVKVVDSVADANGTHTMEFTNGDRITNEKFKFSANDFNVDRSGSEYKESGLYKRTENPSVAVISDIQYYGDANDPVEAIGQIGYSEGNTHSNDDIEKRFEMVFGVKKQ
ncbi:MAG: hypothetical protein J6J27_01460 [Alphaproteobacteria bacterium]|nr:hypothetical protein [Alphaproteobacteria bacterium]